MFERQQKCLRDLLKDFGCLWLNLDDFLRFLRRLENQLDCFSLANREFRESFGGEPISWIVCFECFWRFGGFLESWVVVISKVFSWTANLSFSLVKTVTLVTIWVAEAFRQFFTFVGSHFWRNFNNFRLNEQLKCFLDTNRKSARCFGVYKVSEGFLAVFHWANLFCSKLS